MKRSPAYGATAKTLHWLIAALIVVQYTIGNLMPDIHRGMTPGAAMVLHISIGTLILALMLFRLAWRLTHPVAPESSLVLWQRLAAEAGHWALYALVLGTAFTGWFFASARGFAIKWFFVAALPMLAAENSPLARAVGHYHETFEQLLLLVIGGHAAIAFVHFFLFRDGVMQRMLPRAARGKVKLLARPSRA